MPILIESVVTFDLNFKDKQLKIILIKYILKYSLAYMLYDLWF